MISFYELTKKFLFKFKNVCTGVIVYGGHKVQKLITNSKFVSNLKIRKKFKHRIIYVITNNIIAFILYLAMLLYLLLLLYWFKNRIT